MRKMLIIGRPGSGKSSMRRDHARCRDKAGLGDSLTIIEVTADPDEVMALLLRAGLARFTETHRYPEPDGGSP